MKKFVLILMALLLLDGCVKRIVMALPDKPVCAPSVKKLKDHFRAPTLDETIDLLLCVEILETGYEQ